MKNAKSNALQAALEARWSAFAPRERVLVGSTAALIALALLWWVGISPALAKIKQAREAAPQLEAQLQFMRAQANEVASLKAQRLLGYDESLRSLENSVKTMGTGATLNVNDARASITLRAVSGDALAQWLAQVRANARLVPSELRLKKSIAPSGAAPGSTPTLTATTWDGSIVLNLPAR
jgi:general secretion pathway protein M